MNDLTIRNFKPSDVEDFIRLSQLSFAEETLADGITPQDFEQETRRIFRWNIMPYRLLTALMGVQWEGFVAEVDGKVVGGGMYIGRQRRMVITNLMVDPAYRWQGIGQALLIRRLERLAERGFPHAMAQVLETNTASLRNLAKQDFEVFNRYSVYEHNLPLPIMSAGGLPPITLRDVIRSDRAVFKEIERKITPASVIQVKGTAETQYFPNAWQQLYASFTGYAKWIKVVEVGGKAVGFLCASTQEKQKKGVLIQPVAADEDLRFLPAMIQAAGDWLDAAEKEAMIAEVSAQKTQVQEYLLENGWTKRYTWLELVRWLEEGAEVIFKK